MKSAQFYFDRLNATTSEAERRSVSAKFHAYYATLLSAEQAEAKQLFKPALDELKMRVAQVECEVEELLKKRSQIQTQP